MYACDFSVPQMRQFCLFTYPSKSKWASSEKPRMQKTKRKILKRVSSIGLHDFYYNIWDTKLVPSLSIKFGQLLLRFIKQKRSGFIHIFNISKQTLDCWCVCMYVCEDSARSMCMCNKQTTLNSCCFVSVCLCPSFTM